MAGSISTPPAGQPPALKKSSSSTSTKNQQSIMGFFQKKTVKDPESTLNGLPVVNGSRASVKAHSPTLSTKTAMRGPSSSLTPAPSSDGPEEPPSTRKPSIRSKNIGSSNGLPSPITPASASIERADTAVKGALHFNSPSRKAKKVINYAESGDEDDEEDVFNPSLTTKKRVLKRRKTSPSPDVDDFVGDVESDLEPIDEGTMTTVRETP
ncbi:MAG: hypothetical protein Q9218_008343 [Villophora microphyllina]